MQQSTPVGIPLEFPLPEMGKKSQKQRSKSSNVQISQHEKDLKQEELKVAQDMVQNCVAKLNSNFSKCNMKLINQPKNQIQLDKNQYMNQDLKHEVISHSHTTLNSERDNDNQTFSKPMSNHHPTGPTINQSRDDSLHMR